MKRMLQLAGMLFLSYLVLIAIAYDANLPETLHSLLFL